MSEIRTDTINNASGDNDSGIDLSTNDQVDIKTANTTALTVDASQNVMIGTTSHDGNGMKLQIEHSSSSTDGRVQAHGFSCRDNFGSVSNLGNGIASTASNTLAFATNSTEAMRISDGNLLVGKTANDNSTVGTRFQSDGFASLVRDGDASLLLRRNTSDGNILRFNKAGTDVGSIGINSNRFEFANRVDADKAGLSFHNRIAPMKNGSTSDNQVDLGEPSIRFDDIYATNGTIQTSDQNEKNTITDSDLGIDFIKRLTPKSYIFNGKTRTHYGLIAQDVETVLSDISKPTSGFAGFIKDDISEEQDGSEYRYGLRYTEFVAPLIQAVKDQQAIIEDLQARITALESE